MKRKPERLLTGAELEIMQAVWDRGDTTVRDVVAALPADRPLAYTSVATTMKILEQKGFLKSTKTDRAHTYSARVGREEYEATTLRHLTSKLFKGSPSSLVARLLDDSKLDEAELESIRDWVNRRLEKR